MKNKKEKGYLIKLKPYWPNLYFKKGKTYITKTGDDYIDSIVFILNKKRNTKKLNTTDYPIRKTEILKTHTFNEFLKGFNKGVSQFVKIGYFDVRELKFNDSGEPLNNESIDLKYDNKYEHLFKKIEGVAYIITCKINNREYLIKIGETRKTFKERLKSYNCGNINDIDTASKTNIRMLQTIIANKDFKFFVYLIDCSKKNCSFTFGGISSKKYPTSYWIAVQDICLSQYMKIFGEKPIGNVQAERQSNI